MKFVKRTEAPKETNKFFTTYNPFYKSNYNMFKRHPLLKGNCTHYAYGRFMEANSITACSLPTCNAENWFKKVTKYEKGQTPKVGAVIVYKHKNKSGGHVAFIEEVKSNGDLVLSMSGYNSYLFKTRTVKKSNKYCYSDYKLLGFIYSPNEFEEKYTGEYPIIKSGSLKNGSKGNNVKLLQKFLNWALNKNLTVDGKFGNNTEKAVKEFQKKVSITQDGKFGKNSLAKAKEYKK